MTMNANNTFHRPVSQVGTSHVNKTLANPQGKNLNMGMPQHDSSNINQYQQNKQNGGFNGFGRFS